MSYQYVASVNRYRDTETGRFVARETVLSYTDQIISTSGSATDTLAEMLDEGRITVDEYADRLRTELKDTYIDEYVLGRGGRQNMTQSDWGIVGNMLRAEYRQMEGFIDALRAGELTIGQTRARARLYLMKSRQAFERGNSEAHGIPKLPAYPGDGTTECMNGCHCRWHIVKRKGKGNFDCYWEIDPTVENCETCLARADEDGWAPIEIRGGVIQPYPDLFYTH